MLVGGVQFQPREQRNQSANCGEREGSYKKKRTILFITLPTGERRMFTVKVEVIIQSCSNCHLTKHIFVQFDTLRQSSLVACSLQFLYKNKTLNFMSDCAGNMPIPLSELMSI